MKGRMRLKKKGVLFLENAAMAGRAVKSNRLRSALTITIIALGITSLVGILTAVDSMESTLTEAYSRMGTGSVRVRSLYSMPSQMKRVRNPRRITKAQAEYFAANFDRDATVSVYTTIDSGSETIESGGKKTRPNVAIGGVDENYLKFNMYEVSSGRDFVKQDVEAGRFFCILGSDVSRTLFGADSAVGKQVKIRGRSYTVIGEVAQVGNVPGGGMDVSVLVPYTNALASLATAEQDFVICVQPGPEENIEEFDSRVEMVMRSVRRLSPIDDTDFRLQRSETMMETLDSDMRSVRSAAVVIGIVTLLGAAIGLMNIMLVSVRERTVEIGTRKALGAASSRIKAQFLLESILIGEMGGVIGVIVGIIAGNVVAVLMQTSFVIPWLWIMVAFILCFLVGILSGYIPAKRASALDPIICLHYE